MESPLIYNNINQKSKKQSQIWNGKYEMQAQRSGGPTMTAVNRFSAKAFNHRELSYELCHPWGGLWGVRGSGLACVLPMRLVGEGVVGTRTFAFSEAQCTNLLHHSRATNSYKNSEDLAAF